MALVPLAAMKGVAVAGGVSDDVSSDAAAGAGRCRSPLLARKVSGSREDACDGSVGPPAARATTLRIGRAGYACHEACRRGCAMRPESGTARACDWAALVRLAFITRSVRLIPWFSFP